jgi:hypothetical protein
VPNTFVLWYTCMQAYIKRNDMYFHHGAERWTGHLLLATFNFVVGPWCATHVVLHSTSWIATSVDSFDSVGMPGTQ